MTSLSVCVSYQCVLDRSHCMGHLSPFFSGTGGHRHRHTHTHHTAAHMYAQLHTHTHTHTQIQCFDVNSSGRGVQSATPPDFPPLYLPPVFHRFPPCDTFNGMSRNPVLTHTCVCAHTHTHAPCRAPSQRSAPLSGENHLGTLIFTHIFTFMSDFSLFSPLLCTHKSSPLKPSSFHHLVPAPPLCVSSGLVCA